MMNPVDWLRTMWPRRWRAVVSDYSALREHRHLLADIALRGGVYSSFPPKAEVFEAGWREGRRSLALEIIKAADTDPAKLMELVEKAGKPSA